MRCTLFRTSRGAQKAKYQSNRKSQGVTQREPTKDARSGMARRACGVLGSRRTVQPRIDQGSARLSDSTREQPNGGRRARAFHLPRVSHLSPWFLPAGERAATRLLHRDRGNKTHIDAKMITLVAWPMHNCRSAQ